MSGGSIMTVLLPTSPASWQLGAMTWLWPLTSVVDRLVPPPIPVLKL